jgi:hypothetical protein
VLPRLLNVVVLVVSGGYLLVYLYRWEWNRAVISGVFFIAAEIALATSLVLEELRQGRERDRSDAASAISDVSEEQPARRFEWLAGNDELGVFIPVLLGAGVILSALAYLVERVAGVLAGASVDRYTARLVDVDLHLAPVGGRPEHPAVRASGPRPPATPARVAGWLVAGAAGVLLTVAAVDVLADATQSRLQEQEATTGITVVTLDVDQKNLGRPEADLAEALWIACRSVAPPGAELEGVVPAGGNRVDMVIEPAMGELRRRRVFGCLEDAIIDRVRVDVVDWSIG